MTTENGSTIPKTEGCPLETYVSPIKYSDGVLTLTIPQDVISLRYKYLSQLGTDLASVKQLSDMLIWQKYDAGLDELDTSAIGAGIHALADRSEQYVLGAICEEYSEAADRSKESSASLAKASHRAVIDDALEDIVSGDLSIQAMADRLLAYLQDDHMQMPDDEFLKLGLGLSSEFISKLTADLAAKIDARKGNGAGHE